MKVIKEWILALCVMFLVFSVLFGAVVVYVFVDTDLKNISKRCICPIIISDEDFRQFALEKMLQYREPRELYQQNLAINPDYRIRESIRARTWSYTYWSYIRYGDFRLQAPSDPSLKSNTRSFDFIITADECGRVLNVETMGALTF